MKTVILCGGKGTRLREETAHIPKPLIRVGDFPMLWHIMKLYDAHDIKDFILCLGYKGQMIKDFFLKYEQSAFDFTINLRSREQTWHRTQEIEDWNITFAETGLETLTGGRIKQVKEYVGDEDFLLTYGDGVADVDITKLVEFHKKSGKMVTLTVIHPNNKFGVIRKDGDALSFVEKPPLDDWVNGGFMVCKPEFLDVVGEGMFEQDILPKLAAQGKIALFEHEGFWHCVDTYKDYTELNELWESGNAPWKIWK